MLVRRQHQKLCQLVPFEIFTQPGNTTGKSQMIIGNEACNKPLRVKLKQQIHIVTYTPDNTLSRHHCPSLTRKDHFSADRGILSLFNFFFLLFIADCGTPSLLVTVEEAAELVLDAVVSTTTKD